MKMMCMYLRKRAKGHCDPFLTCISLVPHNCGGQHLFCRELSFMKNRNAMRYPQAGKLFTFLSTPLLHLK